MGYYDKHMKGLDTITLAPATLCSGCTACAAICPVSAIRMEADSEGFLYPAIDGSTCITCSACERVCPVLHRPAPRAPLAVYAAICNDDNIRQQSSSGGLFTLLARRVLAGGGCVVGAGWSDDLRVVHKAARSEAELAELRGSKYVQSELGDMFKQVEEQLSLGGKVLFSGTPCQIAGLKAFLAESPKACGACKGQLLCVDLICHAAPSPGVFARYKREMEARFGAKARRISFRDKHFGWKRYALSFTFENGAEYRAPQDQDPYMQGFAKDLFNRPSCSACSFRELRSGADITLADYWQVHTTVPAFDDDRGTSLLLAVTPSGSEATHALQAQGGGQGAQWAETTFADIRDKNPVVYRSLRQHRNRKAFFRRLDKGPVAALIERLLRPSLSRRWRLFWRRMTNVAVVP